MNKLFKRLPLSLKLLLLILIPLTLIIYLSVEIYNEKSGKANLLHGYLERINQSAAISDLITNLQSERRVCYIFSLKRDITLQPEIAVQREATDHAIEHLESLKDSTLRQFGEYSFLDSLESMRHKIDKGFPADLIMHYYTTSIFRLNTLNLVSAGNNKFLSSVFDALTAQKILNEMVSYLGIIRANFYNALYSRNNNIAMLFGLLGSYDIYNSYEREFLVKASPDMRSRYMDIRTSSELKPTMEYIDHIFKKFSFDTLYAAEDWWKISGAATGRLRDFKNDLLSSAKTKMNSIYLNESKSINGTIILLVTALIIVVSWMLYTTRTITKMLTEIDDAAQQIAKGVTGISAPYLSKDVLGNLSRSISGIDEKNIALAKAADAIGKGNFDTVVQPKKHRGYAGKRCPSDERQPEKLCQEN